MNRETAIHVLSLLHPEYQPVTPQTQVKLNPFFVEYNRVFHHVPTDKYYLITFQSENWSPADEVREIRYCEVVPKEIVKIEYHPVEQDKMMTLID